MATGRRPHRPTDEQRRQVTLLSGYGLQQEQIATFVGVAPKTLRLRYRRELDLGVVQANAQVAKSLFDMAVKDRVPGAAIWWTKARMGWREQQDLNIGGADKPVAVAFTWADATPPAPTIEHAPHQLEGKAAPRCCAG